MVGAIHPREEWQDPRLPVVGPKLPWSAIDTIAPHYTAAVNLIDGDPGEDAALIPAYLRAIQRDYNNRKPIGYSIGYNWAVDWLGGIWELRGWDIKSAAQGAPLNGHVVAVLFLVDGNDEPTLAAQESFRHLNAQARQRAGRKLKVCDHGRLPGAATACAGTGIRRVVDAGWLDDEYDPTPPPPPPPIEEDDMNSLVIVNDKDNPADPKRYAWAGASVVWIENEAEFNELVVVFGLNPRVHPKPEEALAKPFGKPAAWIAAHLVS